MAMAFFRSAASFLLLVVALAQKKAPPPTGGGSAPTGGQETKACVNPTCSSPPCKAALLGDIGCTTVSGTELYKNGLIEKGGCVGSPAHIYGPFEAGFGERQKSNIEGWGCTDPTVAYDSEGGTDIGTAEVAVASKCGITFPRVVGDTWIGIVGPCGGHTKDYHFHRSFSCLYAETGAHSTAVGDIAQWKMYGKWEDFANKKLPYLDACGGHFGVTPDSAGKVVYHYHVQGKAPYTVGCHGPAADNKLVSVAACRALYTECSGSVSQVTVGTGTTKNYLRFCPCFDADGSNAGTPNELPALSTSNISYTDTSTNSNNFGTSVTGASSSTGASTGSCKATGSIGASAGSSAAIATIICIGYATLFLD